uniref:DNA polymerase processivity factor n=1 Tax=Rhizobium phage LG08 TaxID=3129229 RepID=A0AAU8HXY4_9CAUD
MKFENTTIDILKHFASVGEAINIESSPGDQKLYVTSKSKRIIARARNVQDIDLDLPIFNLKNFVQIFSLFSDKDYDITVKNDRAYFRSTDGVYNQSFALSDPDILVVPSPAKVDNIFKLDLFEFEFSNETLSQIQKAIQINGVGQMTFLSEEGTLHILAANMTDKGNVEETANQFKFNTGISVDADFFVGLPAEVLKEILQGNYRVGLSKNAVRFDSGEKGFVDYVFPSLNYSRFG